MGNHQLLACKPPWYVISHPGQLSLAIPPWVDVLNTGESCGVNMQSTRCTIAQADIQHWPALSVASQLSTKETEMKAVLWVNVAR